MSFTKIQYHLNEAKRLLEAKSYYWIIVGRLVDSDTGRAGPYEHIESGYYSRQEAQDDKDTYRGNKEWRDVKVVGLPDDEQKTIDAKIAELNATL